MRCRSWILVSICRVRGGGRGRSGGGDWQKGAGAVPGAHSPLTRVWIGCVIGCVWVWIGCVIGCVWVWIGCVIGCVWVPDSLDTCVRECVF